MPIAERVTFETYLAYDNGTDNRHELVDGRLQQMNLPAIKHCLIAKLNVFRAGVAAISRGSLAPAEKISFPQRSAGQK